METADRFAPQDLAPDEPGLLIAIDVRWGDMDAMGHVNNTLYFRYLEMTRIRYYELLGIAALGASERLGPGLVATNLNFRRQVTYPARLLVQANASRIGTKSFTLDYVIRDAADEAVVADGTSTNVWVDYGVGKALPLPEALVAAIVARERNSGLRPG